MNRASLFFGNRYVSVRFKYAPHGLNTVTNSICKLLVSWLIVLFSMVASAQTTFKGKAVSALTGKPINGALIELDGKSCASTDSHGYFTLELDSANKVSLLFSTVECGNIQIGGLHFKKEEILLIPLPTVFIQLKKTLRNVKLSCLSRLAPLALALLIKIMLLRKSTM